MSNGTTIGKYLHMTYLEDAVTMGKCRKGDRREER